MNMQVRQQMPRHRYKVGQVVDLNPGRLSIAASSQGYEIVRLLPCEGTHFLYRIKCANESFERVVKEQDLASRDPK